MLAVRTPDSVPSEACVGTATTTTGWARLRPIKPALTYGFPVASACLKYVRLEMLNVAETGAVFVLTRTAPVRSAQPMPPLNKAPFAASSRWKYADMFGRSRLTTAGAAAAALSVEMSPAKAASTTAAATTDRERRSFRAACCAWWYWRTADPTATAATTTIASTTAASRRRRTLAAPLPT